MYKTKADYVVYFTPPKTDELRAPKGKKLLESLLNLEVQSDGYSYAAFGPKTREAFKELLHQIK